MLTINAIQPGNEGIPDKQLVGQSPGEVGLCFRQCRAVLRRIRLGLAGMQLVGNALARVHGVVQRDPGV